MKKVYFISSIVALLLYALTSFARSALETYYHVSLICAKVGYSNSDFAVNIHACQAVLLAIAAISLALFVVSLFKKEKNV